MFEKLQNKYLCNWKDGFFPLVLNIEQPQSDIWLQRFVNLKLLNQEIEQMFFRKFTANILLDMCMFITITHKCVHTFLAKKFLVITYPFMRFCVRFHKDQSFCCGVILLLVTL